MRQLKIGKQITNRETQSLDKYLQEIGKVDLITADDEVELAKRIKAGDQAALDKLVKANLRFVVSVAKQYQNSELSLGDLISEGNVGLVKAAMRFDETRGFKFISYAVWWIRQAIMQALAEKTRVVRIPLNQVGSINKLNRAFAELEQKFQREPSIEELAEVLGSAPDEIAETIKLSSRQVSVSAPFSHGEDNSLLEILKDHNASSPDSRLVEDSLRNDLLRSLGTLSQREAAVISLYFGFNDYPKNLDEIASIFELTRERVRQIKEKAIRKLKNVKRHQILKSYL